MSEQMAIVLPEKLTDLRTSKESPTGKMRAIMKTQGAAAETWLDQPEDVYIQAAMQSGWIDVTGVNIPDDATDADIAVLMRASSGLHKTDAWLRGDTALWLRNHKFNGSIPAAELEKLSKLFGCSGKRILNSATTSAAFPKSTRLPEVSFSMYELAAKIEDANARNLLIQQAASEGWSVRTMNEKVAEWIATGSTVDEEGNVTTPGVAVINENGESVVVQGNVVVSATSGLSVNVDACIADMLDYMMLKGLSNGSVGIVRDALEFYVSAGLVKFPPRAWAVAGDREFTSEKQENRPAKRAKKAKKPAQEMPEGVVDVDDEALLPF